MHTNTLAEIRTAVHRLLPAGTASSAGPIADAYPPLAPAELAVTGRMTANRLQEFCAGRAHARTALQELGLRSPVVPVGPGRAPLWPAGFVGSISHAGNLALAVAAPSTVLRAIGVDLEPNLPLDMELLNRVCRPEELARLPTSRLSGHLPLHQAKLIFSAKECVYKCIAPLMGIFLEFADLEILFDSGEGTFRARGHGLVESLINPDTVTGRFAEAGGYWVAVAWQRPGPQSGPGTFKSRVS